MFKKITVFLILGAIILSAGCAPQITPASPQLAPTTAVEQQASPVPPSTEAAPAAPTDAPTEVITEPSQLTVLAAASLTEPFNEIAKQFEGDNPGLKVDLSYAGSQQLAQQLADGAPADVFASASKKYMDAAIEKGRVDQQDAQTFVKNRLVIIYPTNNPSGIKELKDLQKSGLKLVLAAKEVPVGQYTLDFLDKAIKDPAYGAAYKDDTLKNVVSYEDNVKSVLTKIVLGEGDAGIVYSSDISGESAGKVGKIDIPDDLNVIATYPIAAIKDSKNADLAKAFVGKVLSSDGQKILEKYGFQPVQAAAPEASTKTSQLTILAAASLTEPFNEIAKQFEGENSGLKVALSFAGSQQLAQQLADGAPADVFASASKKYMDAAIESGRVDKQDAQTFAKNRLVVIYPTNNAFGFKELKDLAKPGLKLVLGAKEVPCGQYALDFLDKASKDPAYGSSFKEDTLKNVVSYEDNVKSILTKIVLGEGDAGIVYVTDSMGEAAGKIGKTDIPDELNVIATYPIAAIKDSKNADLAKAFVEKILASDGQKILEKYGFQSGQGQEKVSKEGEAKGFVVTDALNRQVSFSTPPQHIAIVGKALFMLADAAYTFPEAASRIAVLGDTAQGTHNFIPLIDPAYKDKSVLTGDVGAEQIAAVKPDAVLLKSYLADTLGKPLEVLGIPVVYLNLELIDQYPQDLKTLGALFQNEERAAQVIAFMQERVERVQNKVKGLDEAKKPPVLLLYYTEKEGAVAFNVAPLTWMQTEMVEKAGGTAIWKDANLGKGWTVVNLEQIIAWDPDQIFIISYFKDPKEVLETLKSDAQWQALRAVKDGKLFPFASDLYSWDEPDIRWVLGLTWLAGKLHPDLFPDLDIKTEVVTFYKDLYGMDEAAIQKDILPKLTY